MIVAVSVDQPVKAQIARIIVSLFEKRPGSAHRFLTKTIFEFLIIGMESASEDDRTAIAAAIADLIKFTNPRMKSTVLVMLRMNGIERPIYDQIKAAVPTSPHQTPEQKRQYALKADRVLVGWSVWTK